MGLFKTSILNGVAVLIKMATMFILNKILAIYVGPSGYAVIGQFQNFIQMITSFSGGAINTGVIKYTAEYYDDEQRQQQLWRTAGTLVVILSVLFAVGIITFKDTLSLYIFQTIEYANIFIWFAIFLVFFNFNALFLAILNGKKEIVKLVVANIAGSIFALVITSILAIQYQLYGALVALSIYQSLAFFVTLLLCFKSKWFKLQYLWGSLDAATSCKLSSFALMALASAICLPLSQIIIRQYLMDKFDANYAGYWEAMIRLSAAYLMLVTTTLSVYYLPRLSELKNIVEIKKEVYLGYKFIFPIALIGGLSMYVMKDFIIQILFSESFLPMRELFFWQIVGDALKIGSWILAFLMLSKAMTKLFVITEIIFAISSVILAIIGTKLFGFEGVAIAHTMNYAIYWIVMGIFVFKKLQVVGNKNE